MKASLPTGNTPKLTSLPNVISMATTAPKRHRH